MDPDQQASEDLTRYSFSGSSFFFKENFSKLTRVKNSKALLAYKSLNRPVF